MVRQRRIIAVVGTFLVGCVVLLMVVGCAGVRSEAPQEDKQDHTEATASEEARCDETRTVKVKFTAMGTTYYRVYTTNDVPGCPYGGLLSGTDKADNLAGKDGDDEIHGLGGVDAILGGGGNDVIYGGDAGDNDKFGGEGLFGGEGEDVLYGGDGNDDMGGGNGEDVLYGGDGSENMYGDNGEDVLYGGDGNDWFFAHDKQRDKLYCGEGSDAYMADKIDYVSSSCEDPFVT